MHESQTQQRRGYGRQRKVSRGEAVLLEVERFSKRTISVCLSQQEEESDLPTLAEVSTYEAIASDDGDEDVGNISMVEDGDREGEHTIS